MRYPDLAGRVCEMLGVELREINAAANEKTLVELRGDASKMLDVIEHHCDRDTYEWAIESLDV